MRGLKRTMNFIYNTQFQVASSRMRGLKPFTTAEALLKVCRILADAWIETIVDTQFSADDGGRILADAWIETLL